MAYEFRMPDLGEGVAEGEIVRWLVAPGQEVAEDDLLVEIQTDKATVEVPSPASGVVSRILAEEGDVIPVGELLVVIGAEIAAVLAEKAILDLRGPVLRVTGYDVPYPYWQIEDAYMPSVERVADAVRRLLAF